MIRVITRPPGIPGVADAGDADKDAEYRSFVMGTFVVGDEPDLGVDRGERMLRLGLVLHAITWDCPHALFLVELHPLRFANHARSLQGENRQSNFELGCCAASAGLE